MPTEKTQIDDTAEIANNFIASNLLPIGNDSESNQAMLDMAKQIAEATNIKPKNLDF